MKGDPAVSHIRYRSFEKARDFVRKLQLKSVQQYWNWCKGLERGLPKKPQDIPTTAHQVYKKEWVSFSDYLGTRRTATYRRKFLPFAEAREFATALCLGSVEEWQEYACGRLHVPGMSPRPDFIPSNPNFTYKLTGWAGMADWLGYGGPSHPLLSRFRPFTDARDFARSLNLSGWLEWRELVRGKLAVKLPSDIPAIPHSAYKGEGWIDYGDWLGTGSKAYHQSPFLPHNEAQEFVGTLELRNMREWRAYCSGRIERLAPKPGNIPTNPDKAYPDKWVGWKYWLNKR